MENLVQNLKKIIEPQIQECVSKIRDYISNYSLLPVIEKAFINDNFIYEKPHYKIASGADLFLQQLNKCDSKLGFTIEKEFLTSDIQTQNNILSQIESLKQQAQIREKSSVFSFILESEKMGISFICFKNNSIIPNTNYFLNYMHDKQSNYLIGTWAFIVYSLNPYEVNKIIIEK